MVPRVVSVVVELLDTPLVEVLTADILEAVVDYVQLGQVCYSRC